MIKKRIVSDSNYMSIYINGRTLRVALDPSKPITLLKHPEFYDVKITDQCHGCCPYCYMDSQQFGRHFTNICGKIEDMFGSMDEENLPYQFAIGGGEPTSHPDFVELLQVCDNLGITPNYTTNGMWIDQENSFEVLEATRSLCGGVAVSCHPHLKQVWMDAVGVYIKQNVRLNLHSIISDKNSIDEFMMIYDKYSGNGVEHFVLLPYGVQGRAIDKVIDWDYLVEMLPEGAKDLAFGANFYPYLCSTPKDVFNVSLYEPEIMSGFLDLDDCKVYKSSFNLIERRVII